MKIQAEPRYVWWGAALFLLLISVTMLASPWNPQLRVTAEALQFLAILVANLVGVRLGLRIAREHDDGTLMRRAWVLIAAGLLANAVRTLFEVAYLLAGQTSSATSVTLGLRQLPIVVSMAMFGGGFAAMWSSLKKLHLGVRLRAADWCAIACIVLLVPPVVLIRHRMNDAASPLAWIRYLQYASPFLLAVAAAFGLVLYRISREMGEGLMALALRLIAASFAIRLLLLATRALPDVPGGGAAVALSTALFLANVLAHWTFLLGLVYRWRLSRTTVELLERYQRDKDRQLALLAQKVP